MQTEQPETLMLPNFFIVGAPKAGTTSLYHYLDEHPDVFMSPIKEPNYFSYEPTIKQELYYQERGIGNWDEYKNLFEYSGGKKAVGEASVSYLFYKEVPQLIKNKIQDARIIILLRNPVERAFSHYQMDCKLGYVNTSFEKIIFSKNRTRLENLFYQQFILLGLYYEQVKRYLDVFGAEKVLVILFDDFKNDTEKEIKRLYRFLEIDETIKLNLGKTHNTFAAPRNRLFSIIYRFKKVRMMMKKFLPQKIQSYILKIILTKKKTPVDEKTINFLNEFYKPDILKLEKLLNRNLSAWYE